MFTFPPESTSTNPTLSLRNIFNHLKNYQNVLEDKDFIFDMEIKLSFICDMIHGMEYLHHHTSIGSHGYLKSSNVLVTGCLTAKIADFGTLCRLF